MAKPSATTAAIGVMPAARSSAAVLPGRAHGCSRRTPDHRASATIVPKAHHGSRHVASAARTTPAAASHAAVACTARPESSRSATKPARAMTATISRDCVLPSVPSARASTVVPHQSTSTTAELAKRSSAITTTPATPATSTGTNGKRHEIHDSTTSTPTIGAPMRVEVSVAADSGAAGRQRASASVAAIATASRAAWTAVTEATPPPVGISRPTPMPASPTASHAIGATRNRRADDACRRDQSA